MDLSGLILSDPVNKWVFTQYKKEAYLVGGYVRDLLRGEISNDKDYAVKGDVEQVAMEAARRFNGTLVTLRKDHTYRIVMKDKSVMDFSSLQDNIEKDLYQRDYTINAIAWSPGGGLLDITGGIQNLQNKLIRAVSSDNILKDPLRIVRAYRLAAQLEFDIDENTRTYLRNYSPQILNVSAERVTNEIFRMLSCLNSFKYIKLCLIDNVLHEVLGIPQDILTINMAGIKKIEIFWQSLNANKRDNFTEIRLKRILSREISQSLNAIGLIRLFILSISPKGPPSKNCLLMSSKIRRSVNGLRAAYQPACSRPSGKIFYEMLRIAEGSEYELMTLIAVFNNLNVDEYLIKADEYLQAKNHPFLTGDEIQDALNISPGQQIGEVKEEIKRMQFTGKLKNKREAREWIISNLT